MQIGQHKRLQIKIFLSYLVESIENYIERKSSLRLCINANFDLTFVSSADKAIFFYMSE